MKKIIQLTASFIFAGLLVFITLATFDEPTYQSNVWSHSYAVWNKISFTLLSYIAWKLSVEKYGNHLRPVFWVCVIRLVWDITAWIGGWSINNMWVVSILFLIYLSYVSYKALANVRSKVTY